MVAEAKPRSGEITIITGSPKKVVSFKLDVSLIEEIDRVWSMLGYSSRSEFIRDAVIYYMQVAVRLKNGYGDGRCRCDCPAPGGVADSGAGDE
ncbi:MAG: hypothetical protein DSY37_02920 [Hyperthermus sp.]|nr:MAG: hypothetical protein DSY37_02920 [Hyperthermus sp.]